MKELFTNSNKRGDFLKYGLQKYAEDTEIFIAVAFLTDKNFIMDAIKNGCSVKLILRLCHIVNSNVLTDFINTGKVSIRFFTSQNFHPKLYIFGERIAFVGSSNLTSSGLISNQEINISIDSENPVFDTLQIVFNDYWNEAEVLTPEVLKKFESIPENVNREESNFNQRLIDTIGDFYYPDVVVKNKKKDEKGLFTSHFLRDYQEYLLKFDELKQIYTKVGIRKSNELPLRIEVDRFLSWVRESYAKGNSYETSPKKTLEEISSDAIPLIEEFINEHNEHFDLTVSERYPVLQRNFSSPEKIDKLTKKEIYDTLLNVNAFQDQFRFFQDGYENMEKEFLEANSEAQLKKTIKYLLFGSDEFQNRVANTVFEEEYKLNWFAKSSVKELLGLVNDKDIPTCNDRMLKSMQWLGFGKFL